MKIDMIAMDLDGTALRPDGAALSPRMERAIAAAYEKGVCIVPVTGRPYGLLPPFLQNHPYWESCSILCNGAQIRDLKSGEILSYLPIPREKLQEIFALTRKYDLLIELNANGNLYLTRDTLLKERKLPDLHLHCSVLLPQIGRIVDSLESGAYPEVEKIHINGIPEAVREEAEQDLKALELSVVCEKHPRLEVTHRQATKGEALQILCDHMQISMDRVMALGDSGNDLTMLQAAGFSVAMGSAPEFIKNAADYVTQSNQLDGAAAAIERFVLS